MCGIFGVIGREGAPEIVHRGLRRLEYRGYDSAGIAWQNNGLHRVRAVGPVANLEVPSDEASMAIGHTRWATHGGVTQANAHPHFDSSSRAAVVHNGVLLNHEQLRAELVAAGATFTSETDSEVLAHLWRKAADEGRDAWGRLSEIMSHLAGTYSVAFLDADTDVVAVAKHRNPLWVAVADGVTYLASDAVALAPHCSEATPLEDGDQGLLAAGSFELRDRDGNPVERSPLPLDALGGDVGLGGYEHFMLKEIHETGHAANAVIGNHVRRHKTHVVPDALRPTRFLGLGAGTSYYAATLTAEYVRRLARIPASAAASPEWKDDPAIPEPDALVVAFSQSGETLDTVQALAQLHSHPQRIVAFTNYPQSTIGRQSDVTVPLHSGVEISVAATKTFLSQSLLGLLLAVQMGMANGTLGYARGKRILDDLIRLPRHLDRIGHDAIFQEHAAWLAGFENAFVLAKGCDLPAAFEGALKLKEIAYQHAEAYPAGELKHGPFALLTESTPVIFLLGDGEHADSVRNSLEEVAARGAPTLVLAVGDVEVDAHRHRVIRLPAASRLQHPLLHATAMHSLAYWTAKARGLPIDKPRNLAKSVTVE